MVWNFPCPFVDKRGRHSPLKQDALMVADEDLFSAEQNIQIPEFWTDTIVNESTMSQPNIIIRLLA